MSAETGVAHTATATEEGRTRLGRFAVKGVFWREYLDWAVINLPFYFYPMPLFFFTIFFFFFAAPARRAIVANLSVVLPGSSRMMNYLRAFRTLYNFAWTISETAIHRRLKSDFHYELIGAEALEALGTGKGAIVLTAHMGSYDLGAALFAEKFRREIRVVRAPEPDRKSGQHLTESLTQSTEGAVKVDYNTAGAMLSFDLLRALREGEIVSIQGDRLDGGVAATTGRLFGRDVQLPNGPFVLSLVSEAPIYPLFIARAGCRAYQVIVHEPIRVENTGRREHDIANAVTKWCEVLEEVVLARWEQWFAFAPVFPR
jgi:lauroyl/myristoyl acyltransferase